MRLCLYFTKNISLETWSKQGMFNREIALYQRLSDLGVSIDFITYGDRGERQFSNLIPNINIRYNSLSLPSNLYQSFLPWIHHTSLRNCDVIKTNQTYGSDIALRAAQQWNKPLIARCGYMWSEFISKQKGINSPAALQAQAIETKVFRAAAKIVVTTPMMAKAISQRLPDIYQRTTIIPNYVETDRFRPYSDIQKKFDLVFVGRIEDQKNVHSLLEAIEPLSSISLLIIGNGTQRKSLQQNFTHLGDRVQWQGNVPNSELPKYLNQAKIFILPSYYEGHPKALIEAMACGLPVIGTRAPGICELIEHQQNGWLCSTNPSSIRDAIVCLCAQPYLHDRMGQTAREFVLDNFSLDRIVELEFNLLQEVSQSRH